MSHIAFCMFLDSLAIFILQSPNMPLLHFIQEKQFMSFLLLPLMTLSAAFNSGA